MPESERSAFSVLRFVELYPSRASRKKQTVTIGVFTAPTERKEEIQTPLISSSVAALLRAECADIRELLFSLTVKVGAITDILSGLEGEQQVASVAPMLVAPASTVDTHREESPLPSREPSVVSGKAFREQTRVVVSPKPSPPPLPPKVTFVDETIDTLLKDADYVQARQVLQVIFYDMRAKQGGEEKITAHVRFSKSLLKRYLGGLYDEDGIVRETTIALLLLYRWWRGSQGPYTHEGEKHFKNFIFNLKRNFYARDKDFYGFLRDVLERDRAQDRVDLTKFFELINFHV